jgi:hypothetical protein
MTKPFYKIPTLTSSNREVIILESPDKSVRTPGIDMRIRFTIIVVGKKGKEFCEKIASKFNGECTAVPTLRGNYNYAFHESSQTTDIIYMLRLYEDKIVNPFYVTIVCDVDTPPKICYFHRGYNAKAVEVSIDENKIDSNFLKDLLICGNNVGLLHFMNEYPDELTGTMYH